MDRYMGLLWWSLKHRWKTMLIGVAAFIATIFAFGTLPFTFQPNVNSDFTLGRGGNGAGLDPPADPEASPRQAADIVRKEPDVKSAFASIRVGGATIYITLNKDRERTSTEFERQVVAQAPRDRRRARLFPLAAGLRQSRRRDHAVRRRSGEAGAGGERDRRGHEEAARGQGAADRGRPAGGRRSRSSRASTSPPTSGVTTAALSQTIRIATQGEIDQNSAKFSLSDRQIPIRVSLQRGIAPEPLDHRESAGADRQRRLGAPEGHRRDRLRRRPDPDPALQPAAPDRRRRRPRPRRRRGDEQDQAAALLQEPPRRGGACPPGRAEDAGGADLQLHHGGGRRHLPRLRGAGAALQEDRAALREHGLAAARAARRGDRAASHRQRHVDAGADRDPDAARDRRQELDPADRLRDRGDGQGRREARGDRRRRPQARPADRHDDGGDGRRNASRSPSRSPATAAGGRRWESSSSAA